MDSHFKFLGRWMRSDLKEQQVSARVETQYWAWINLVDSSGVNGLMKLWLYQFGILRGAL